MREQRDNDNEHDLVMVNLDEIHVPERTWNKILRKDRGQVEEMRLEYESGRLMMRVILRPCLGGGYNIEDGRHRVIAAKLACAGFIEALIVGD